MRKIRDAAEPTPGRATGAIAERTEGGRAPGASAGRSAVSGSSSLGDKPGGGSFSRSGNTPKREPALAINPEVDDSRALTFFCDEQRHLVCLPYNVENLHIMASRLRLPRIWYHAGKVRPSRVGHPHYDIPVRRYKEIKAKCIVLTSRDVLALCKDGRP